MKLYVVQAVDLKDVKICESGDCFYSYKEAVNACERMNKGLDPEAGLKFEVQTYLAKRVG